MDEENKIGVYIKVDDNNNITDINSDIFISDTSDYIKIDKGVGDRYAHAQGCYLEKNITADYGIYRYKYIDNAITEKTVDEIKAEEEKIKIHLTETELLQKLIDALISENEFLSDCLVEMAQVVYA